MSAYRHVRVPTDGERIDVGADGALARARPSDHPVHRGRRHRPRHLARLAGRLRRRGRRRPTAASAGSPGWRSSPARRRTSVYGETLAARRDRRGHPRVQGRDQGPAHHAGRRRHPQLNVTLRQVLDLYACVRPVRCFEGVPSPGEGAGEAQRRHLPREHRGRLRRHRVQGRARRKRKKLIEFLAQRARRRRSAPDSGIGIKPMSRVRLEAAGAHGDRVRHRARPAERHPGAQGQHHEVHRGRVPRLGLRAREATSSRDRDRAPRTTLGEARRRCPRARSLVKDRIADSMFQQVLLRPDEYERARDAEPERRLPLRRLRRAGRRPRHRAGRQHRRRARRSSRRPTAPRRSTPARTRSTRAR